MSEINTKSLSPEDSSEDIVEFPDWFKLDTAAIIYPNAQRYGWDVVYRFAFIMKDEVDPDVLRQAVEDIAPRFPWFFANVKRGLFWHYYQRAFDYDIVEAEDYYPCRYIQLSETTKPAMRIYYFKNRISIETFHGLADGGAALIFNKTLVARYLELKGVKITRDETILNIDELPKKYEIEDSFRTNYKKMKGLNRKEETAYRYDAKPIKNYYKVIHGLVPVEDLKNVSRENGMTITEFLMVAYLYAFYATSPKKINKPIKISIPASLRPRFNSKTMRNFSLYANIGFNPKGRTDITFEEIFNLVKGKMEAGLATEELQKMVSINVRDASNPVLRLVPSVLKKPVMKFIFDHGGENKFTSGMTNLGIVKLPPEMYEHVERVECLLGSSPNVKLLCAMITYNNMINITFTSDSDKTDVQREFFRVLSEKGIRVRVECNCKE